MWRLSFSFQQKWCLFAVANDLSSAKLRSARPTTCCSVPQLVRDVSVHRVPVDEPGLFFVMKSQAGFNYTPFAPEHKRLQPRAGVLSRPLRRQILTTWCECLILLLGSTVELGDNPRSVGFKVQSIY